MIFQNTHGPVEEPYSDARGFTWSTLKDYCLLVSNPLEHTLRGIHYQVYPYDRAKIVQVISGKTRFVKVDLISGAWVMEDLAPGQSSFVRNYEGAGYVTLEPNTVVWYEMSVPHAPECERGIRWNDPFLGIEWGVTPAMINDRDRNWPDWSPHE